MDELMSPYFLFECCTQTLLLPQVLEASARSFSSLSHTIMSGSEEPYQPEEDPEDQSETQGLVGGQVFSALKQELTSSTLSSPSLILIFLLVSDLGIMEEASAEEMMDVSQCPEGGSSPQSIMEVTLSMQSLRCYSRVQERVSFASCTLANAESLFREILEDKVAELMEFLAFKYLKKEPTSVAEMQMVVTRDYEEHFLLIFREACNCLQLVFGIDVKKMDPPSHYYVLSPSLGLTYDGMIADEQNYPRTILLIIILGAIHVRGNRVTEETIWEVLSGMGLYPGKVHRLYGEPRKFLTEDLVREQYLAYLEVSNTIPPRYEFLWGPRAHAETSEEKVLEFLGRLKDTTFN
ncbi:melanoma-associated antigen 8-like [Cavia porcellus]|uniref:melanoma-associated antigen 8-like n=1 Tax=Cavia porcellus TaxID=10141 RepID=UPI000661F961